MKYLLLGLLLWPIFALACPGTSNLQLGHFIQSTDAINHSNNKNKTVVIDTGFVKQLLTTPTAELFHKNRYELYYLVSRGDKQALLAGLKSLAYILKNPAYITECDKKVEIYKKEEIAHTLSRSESFSNSVCELTADERQIIFDYYQANKQLYQLAYDAPWEFDACNDKQ